MRAAHSIGILFLRPSQGRRQTSQARAPPRASPHGAAWRAFTANTLWSPPHRACDGLHYAKCPLRKP